MPEKTVYLVDGTSLCYRSFFAIRLSNSRGFSTGAVYGFYQTLKKIIAEYHPIYMGICFDVSRKTFRQEKFKEYKIQRPPIPDDLKAQIPIIKKVISSLGIKIIEKEGFEADDIIASLCKKATRDNASVVVVSSDKDLYQLLSLENVSFYNYNKEILFNKAEFLKEYGFVPELIKDYLSLAGDASDNIPGARGIGKVGASKLIQEFGNIENIFDNLDKVGGRLHDILNESKKDILLSKELVELCFCDLPLDWQDLKIATPNNSELYSIFKELEFKAFLKDLPTPVLDLDMEIKNGMSKDLMEDLSKEPFSLFVSGQELFIFDQRKNCIYQIEPRDLRNILQDRSIRKISHGLKDRLFSLKEIRLEGLWFDTEIAAYLVDSSLSDYSVAALASHYLGRQIVDIPAKFMPYFIYQLYKVLSVKLEEKKLTKLFFETEMPLVSVLRDMEVEGLRVDAGVLCDLSREVDKRAHAAETKIFEMAGKKFNLNSPKQLASILFGELKIPPLKKTKTGYSTNEEVLEKLALQYPIAEAIMEYRYLNKLKTTYIIPLIEDVEKSKGRLYARFNQTATGTGRLSSSSPNLQSIPIKGELSFWLRRAFIPTSRDGYILSGDYSQIELRILAHLSGDSNLVAAFKQDLDIHQFTATLLFGVNKEEVTVQQRDIAKRVNFGIIYGMSSYGLSKELKIAPIEAQNFIDDYFNRYPKVKEYIERIQQLAEKDGFVGTILGRQRPLAEINSPNVQLREFAHRQAVNAPIQGSCADLIKVAMVRIYSALKQKKLNAKLIIQIHDELIFDVPGEELDQVEALVKKHMEEAIALKVPIRVNIAYGKNWGELKAIA